MNIDDNGAPSTPAEGEASAPQDGEQLPTESSQEQPPVSPEPSENFQKRIDTVVGQRNDMRDENASLRQQLEAQSNVEVQQIDVSEPTLEQFDHDEDKHQSALIDYRVQKGVAAGLTQYSNQQKAASAQVTQETRVSNYNLRAQDFASTTPDFVEKAGGLRLSTHASNAIMRSDVGPQVAYAIANNPALEQELNHLDSDSVLMRIGEMAANVRAAGISNKISTAPDPVIPATGAGGAMKESELGNLSMDEFMANQGVVKTSR